MRCRFLIFMLSTIFATSGYAQHKVNLPASFKQPIAVELKPFYAPSEGELEDLLKGNVISVGKVHSPTDKEQQLMLFVSGVHPRNCTRAMRKLALYENYSSYMDFIKQSQYDEAKQQVTFVMDHLLLPFPMNLTFKIPRIKGEGVYPFTFDHGFLKDLKGSVVVKHVGKFCSLSLKTDWRGPETKIPNVAFEAFLQTVGKLGLEHLIRVSIF